MAKRKAHLDISDAESNIFNFLKKSYDETMKLMAFSRDYFSTRGHIEKSKLSTEDSLAYTLAMSTITTQLTSVMSWLLMCRAVQEGEITTEELKDDEFRMAEYDLNFEEGSCFANLDNTIKELFKRSSSLYNRVKRMENSIVKRLGQKN